MFGESFWKDGQLNQSESISDVVAELRAEANRGSRAIELAISVRNLLGNNFGVISFIAVFNEAFGIPLHILQQALAWHEFKWGQVHISDEEFKSLIDPWIDRSV
ncbi:hypothetical protein [Streptosporangium sp. NPDC003464]